MSKKAMDMNAIMKEAMENAPVDLESIQEQLKSSAAYGEKLAQVALDAAMKSNEVSSNWTKQTLANFGAISKVQEDPSELAKTMSDFASAQGELATANAAAFAEIAKAVQAQTIELLLSAGAEAAPAPKAAARKKTGK